MSAPAGLYADSRSLLTDLYQLTMAYGYWKCGIQDREAVFHLFFRKNPFGGAFSLACGLGLVVDYLRHFQFDDSDLQYLHELKGNDGEPLFDGEFLSYLGGLRLTCDIDGIPEGMVVFPSEPLLRVRGPILQCQLLETALLNITNFQTLVATKSARVCMAARGDPVLEFGLRRAQGVDGGLAASRAAYVGGCVGTSNVLAGKYYGIPVKGTHAHSWILCFEDEVQAFEAYADAMPNNGIFLVDTYDSLEGVRRAVEVGRSLRERGFEMVGIRLDSGDLGSLSVEARRILDEAGFPGAAIVASNDLDEHSISTLKANGAKIGVWGVGTRLATAYDQPAMGGVYKLSAVREPGGDWDYKVKLSEEMDKTTDPGIHQVRRFHNEGRFLGDVIYDEGSPPGPDCRFVDPNSPGEPGGFLEGTPYTDLLIPVCRAGELIHKPTPLAEARERAQDQLSRLAPGVRRLSRPDGYPVGLEMSLHVLKQELIAKARARETGPGVTTEDNTR